MSNIVATYQVSCRLAVQSWDSLYQPDMHHVVDVARAVARWQRYAAGAGLVRLAGAISQDIYVIDNSGCNEDSPLLNSIHRRVVFGGKCVSNKGDLFLLSETGSMVRTLTSLGSCIALSLRVADAIVLYDPVEFRPHYGRVSAAERFPWE